MSTQTNTSSDARVTGVNGSVVSVEADTAAIVKNEVCYVCVGDRKLKAEVLRIHGRTADIQVFEETEGVQAGDLVEFTGQLLSVDLGPGLLGGIYDGLQNPLSALAEKDGFFLQRGRYVAPLNNQQKWAFTPTRKPGDKLRAGDTIGTVQERHTTHKIMIPFGETNEVELLSVESGSFAVDQVIAKIRVAGKRDRTLTMTQAWPVRRRTGVTASVISRKFKPQLPKRWISSSIGFAPRPNPARPKSSSVSLPSGTRQNRNRTTLST